ncbi:PAS domain-containing protein [bacterium]|nr:PAS domain-containing protein [bacterium]
MSDMDIQNRYEELLNSLPDGIFIIDSHGRIELANKAAAAILGYSDKKDFLGLSVSELYAIPGDHDALLSILGHKGKADKTIFDWKKKNGETTLIEFTASPIHDKKGHIKGIHGIFRDISRKLESQIAQQETLAETAARSIDEDKLLEVINFFRVVPMSLILQGVAHNLNTPLGTIRGRAELLQHHIKKNANLADAISNEKAKADILEFHAKLDKSIGEIVTQVDKASALIKGFSDKVSSEMNPYQSEIDVNRLVENEISFLDSSLYFKHQIKKEIELDRTVPPILGIYRDFSQAIHNLIIESMKATGSLGEKVLRIKTSHDRNFIYIELSDNRTMPASTDLAYHLSIHTDTMYGSLPDEAQFSQYDIEIANASRLLSLYQADLNLFPNNEPKFVIQIPKP